MLEWRNLVEDLAGNAAELKWSNAASSEGHRKHAL